MSILEQLAICVDDFEDIFDLSLFYLMEQDQLEKDKKPIFNFDKIEEVDCRKLFRFEKEDVLRLVRALRIPNYLTTPNGTRFSGIEGLCIFLRRICYPNRYFDLTKLFPRSITELSRICTRMLNYIYDNYNHLLTTVNHPWLSQHYLQMYADAIHNKRAPLQNCIGFVDGTLRPTCKPKFHQRELFSGHKRLHGIKFQACNLANGLIFHLYGPIPGRRHDSYMLNRSGLLDDLTQLPRQDLETPFCIYGDSAYPLRSQLVTPFKNANLTQEQAEFNRLMSKSRASIEWEFGKLDQQFAFMDFKKNLKLNLQPIAKMYIVSTIIKNCHNCLYGCQTSLYFNVDPPNLEEYLYLQN